MIKMTLIFSPGVLAALGAGILFGGSTPFAKLLTGNVSPILLAGLLYFGSGFGITLIRFLRDRGWSAPVMPRREWKWFAGSIVCGGIIGPTLLMVGLAKTSAATASLLLNLEAVFTALLAWFLFHENADSRIVLGMCFIVAGGVILSAGNVGAAQGWLGPLFIAGACLCWAIDNNLARKVSATDALFIAGSKGLTAGIVNICLALIVGVIFPQWLQISSALLIGFVGYGISLVLFVLALRGLGSARTGAYFSTAPFVGAAIAILFFHETATLGFWLAAVLMAVGVWLHLTEQHLHEHTHEALTHTHRHVHDEHHQHEHDFPWNGKEPHTHPHQHLVITHSHPHYPDIHHRHRH